MYSRAHEIPLETEGGRERFQERNSHGLTSRIRLASPIGARIKD